MNILVWCKPVVLLKEVPSSANSPVFILAQQKLKVTSSESILQSVIMLMCEHWCCNEAEYVACSLKGVGSRRTRWVYFGSSTILCHYKGLVEDSLIKQ